MFGGVVIVTYMMLIILRRPLSSQCRGYPKSTGRLLSHIVIMAAYTTCLLGSSPALDRNCWLCGRESDILRYRHSRNHRSALFREISLPKDVSEREIIASISAVIAVPPRSAGGRRKLRSPMEKTTHDSTYIKTTTKTWTFHVHSDCWDLVACRVSDPTACATAFCKSLLANHRDHTIHFPTSTPHSRSSCPPPRSSTTPAPGRNARRANMHQLESFDGLAAELGLDRLPSIHKPVSLEQLDLFSYTTTPTKPLPHLPSNATTTNDPFTLLPPELLHLLACHTPTPSLLRLRLASRAVACATGLTDLPRRFWRSRFGLAFEMGFALPIRVGQDNREEERELDWRGVYFLLRGALGRYCSADVVVVGGPRRVERPLLARLAKRRFWWERLGRVVVLTGEGGGGGDM